MAYYEELRAQRIRVEMALEKATDFEERKNLSLCLRDLKLACEEAYRQEIKGEL